MGAGARARSRRLRSTRHVALLAAVSLVMTACATDSDSSSEALAAIRLEPNSATSLDRIDITGVPGDVDPTMATVWVKNGGEEAPLPILFGENGDLQIVAPLHPSDPMEGGTVELVFEHDGERSPELQLEVTPLPAAPGAWDETIAQLRRAIAHRAEESGMTFADLQAATLEDLPPVLRPLKVAQVYVDDGSENDLESWLTSAASELSEEDRELIDALMAKLDFAVLIGSDGSISSFRGHGVPPPALGSPSHRLARAAAGEAVGCIEAGVEVTDAFDLAAKMEEARSSTITADDPRRKVLDDIASVTFYGGFLPGIGTGMGAIGLAFTALEAYNNAQAGLYPSKLVSLRIGEVTGDTFAEDFTSPHYWFDVMAVAASTGWTADTDVAKVVLAASSTAGGVATARLKVLDSAPEGAALGVATATRDAAGVAFVERHKGLLDFCPQTWTVDITGERWSSGTAVLGHFEVNDAAQSFQPRETTLNLPIDDTLRITPDRDAFPGQTVSAEMPITVLPIDVDGPEEVNVEVPGKEVEVSITVTNAIDPSLTWTSQMGAWIGEPSIPAARSDLLAPVTVTRTHLTPSDESAYPYVATVESASSTGLRADGDPPRLHVITFRLADIIVQPNPALMRVETTQQFTARDQDGDPVDVVWAGTGGTISGDGLYTAGSEPGTYEVRATSTTDTRLVGTAVVQIFENDECLVGSWQMDLASYQSFIDARIQSQPGVPSGFHMEVVGGAIYSSFDDDGTVGFFQDDLQIAISGLPVAVVSTRNGSELGSYVADGEVMMITNMVGDFVVETSIPGVELGEEATQAFIFGSALRTARYECSQSSLVVQVGAGSFRLSKIGEIPEP